MRDLESNQAFPIIVGISGGSGSVMAQRTIDQLLELGVPVAATCSNGGRMVWQEEMDEPFKETLEQWQESPLFTYYSIGDMKAPIASGTNVTRGMIIVPCSTTTVAAIANGVSTNLLHRAADVCIKEGRKLVIIPRETPLSAIHLENMLKLQRVGATILSPEPGFYLRPKTIDDVVDFIVGRALVAIGATLTMGDNLTYRRKNE
ncbi:UbiX family flavin prenyltransferase [Dehalococcoidia bacterium]|nr:UbiX family flavin prenyltransferase [Dehalococcoidia bacterium]